jgi:ATP-binding cassette, subfamily B, multidrug efflux pump
MENGGIVEKGTHDDLIVARGAYFRLYNSQFQQAATDLDEEAHALAEAERGEPLADAAGDAREDESAPVA